jgi:hypothetical protein
LLISTPTGAAKLDWSTTGLHPAMAACIPGPELWFITAWQR